MPSTERNGAGGTHIYDGVPFDSETIEKPFIEALEKRKDVKLYIKLPSWFTVATPIGAYNPDWAIVMENPDGGDDLLYLVRETKGTLDIDALRPDEKRRILWQDGNISGTRWRWAKPATASLQRPSSYRTEASDQREYPVRC